MDEWKPIETAPKDGTEILAFADGKIHQVRSEEYWNSRVWGTGRYSWTQSGESPDTVEPSHWLPLPKAPEKIK